MVGAAVKSVLDFLNQSILLCNPSAMMKLAICPAAASLIPLPRLCR